MKTARAMPLLWALACGGGTAEPAVPSPASPRGLPRVAATDRPAAKPPEQPPTEPFRWLDEAKAPKPNPPPSESEPDAGKRDYEAELRAAFGDPAGCLTARTGPDAPKEIQIDLEAHLMAAGNVGRSYVRSPQLALQELECLRKRIEPLRLRAPIDDAPRAIRATIKLALETATKTGT